MSKKKLSKGKIVLIVLAALVVLFVVGVALTPTDTDTTTAADTTVADTTVSDTTQAVPARKDAVGKSDKNCDDYFDGKAVPMSMHNDSTGKWKVCTLSTTSSGFEEYALDYVNRYFETQESNEVHWIVNFTNKTTTSVTNLGGVLNVTTYEYVEKEELDAKAIGSGMVLSSFLVYTDNGDIVKAED